MFVQPRRSSQDRGVTVRRIGRRATRSAAGVLVAVGWLTGAANAAAGDLGPWPARYTVASLGLTVDWPITVNRQQALVGQRVTVVLRRARGSRRTPRPVVVTLAGPAALPGEPGKKRTQRLRIRTGRASFTLTRPGEHRLIMKSGSYRRATALVVRPKGTPASATFKLLSTTYSGTSVLRVQTANTGPLDLTLGAPGFVLTGLGPDPSVDVPDPVPGANPEPTPAGGADVIPVNAVAVDLANQPITSAAPAALAPGEIRTYLLTPALPLPDRAYRLTWNVTPSVGTRLSEGTTVDFAVRRDPCAPPFIAELCFAPAVAAGRTGTPAASSGAD